MLQYQHTLHYNYLKIFFTTTIGVTALLLFFAGCQSVSNPLTKIESTSADVFEQEKEEGLLVLSGYYQKLQESDYAAASEFYSDGWYEAMSKVETEDFL